jgi:DNA-binding NarL/FixJ family response regulator
MINVWIVDDHQMVLEGLKLLLDDHNDIKVTQSFKSAQSAIDRLEDYVPDVILLDINMPELNGIEATKIIKRKHPEVKILGLSMISESNLIKLMMKNGADGYLHKNAGQDEIIEAIGAVKNGKTYISSDVSEILFHSNTSQNYPSNSPFPKLSRREEQILQMIIEECTTHEISEKLFISFGTVETHRRNIMIKLGVKNTAGLVRVAFEYNLIEGLPKL